MLPKVHERAHSWTAHRAASVAVVVSLLVACSDSGDGGSGGAAATGGTAGTVAAGAAAGTIGTGGNGGTAPTGGVGGVVATGGSAGAGSGGTAGTGSGGSAGRVLIPAPGDWTDHGQILAAGKPGEWDLHLAGGFAGCAVRRSGQFFLYYQGADGYSDTFGTVTHRAIGVATSSNGLQFTKHAGNPVLNWAPSKGIEEGAVSCGADVSASGTIWMYFGGNEEVSSTQVNADGRYATSSDGLSWQEQGVVLDHAKSSVWGSGDELFPVIALMSAGNYYAYYIPNGVPQKGKLGVAWGPGPKQLTNTAAASNAGQPVQAWGMGSAARLEAGYHALFVSDVQAKTITVYEVDVSQPDTLIGPVAIYQFSNMSQGTLLLDEQNATWYLYYRTASADAYGVRTASMKKQ